jgi:hypothetical protein
MTTTKEILNAALEALANVEKVFHYHNRHAKPYITAGSVQAYIVRGAPTTVTIENVLREETFFCCKYEMGIIKFYMRE